MKQKIAQILVIAMVICTTAFAGKTDDKVNNTILTEFSQKFDGAKEVKWSKTASYYKASFQLNGQFISAYFTNDGEVIGMARNIETKELPVKLQSELKKYISDSWVAELFEYSNDEEIAYYATIENADEKIVVKSAMGSWTLIKKVKKG